MESPEDFLINLRGKRVVLDEVHRLDNPSELLKIAADHYPDVKIIATGSSTLSASAKFKDTLAGRKTELWLTPMMSEDLAAFRKTDMKYRLLRGGLPPFFMPKNQPESDYQEWMDSVWARDIQELFRLERRHSFMKLFELLLLQSGGIFEANRFSGKCEAARQTIQNYLKVLESTFIFNVVRPFHTKKSTEIVKAPKVYAFDTGFVCYFKGIDRLRDDDLGFLWEHYVLNELCAQLQTRNIRYWRDKQGHEVDFVLQKRRGQIPMVIECKWTDRDFDPKNLVIFHKRYPKAKAFVVSHDLERSYIKTVGNLKVKFLGLPELIKEVR